MSNNPFGISAINPNPFQSFWMAGFECTDKLNAFGERVDFLHLTQHYKLLKEDYQQLKPFGISTVREGIRWSQVEKKPYSYDWSVVKEMIKCGKANGIQQIWDICHFGFPDDLTPLHPLFAKRFAALCKAFVQLYRSEYPDDILIVTPINEVSFLSWLGGEVKGTSPYCTKHGWEVKYYLMKAYIEGTAAMRQVDPSVRILTTEPLVNMVPPLIATPEEIENAKAEHEYQFQSIDMLSGRICPELGGLPEYLDIIGLNYYYNNQWIVGTHGIQEFLPWVNMLQDPRWQPLHKLLIDVHNRYNRPLVLTETSHSGVHRPNWMCFIAEECAAALQNNVPLWGVCLYPIIDRPDWDHLHRWHGSGLWDADLANGTSERILNQPYAEALKESQLLVEMAKAYTKVSS